MLWFLFYVTLEHMMSLSTVSMPQYVLVFGQWSHSVSQHHIHWQTGAVISGRSACLASGGWTRRVWTNRQTAAGLWPAAVVGRNKAAHLKLSLTISPHSSLIIVQPPACFPKPQMPRKRRRRRRKWSEWSQINSVHSSVGKLAIS